ncbi:hypothetical protein CCACVL1_02249 [Corchorus capsularis]|uniref:PGG domain-containing protein n=1 Tax=Corchorus capsularis TaxID=210143 RepID=A0A1R3K9Q6_COCAP|nr:hypothetical protein CCACVL1_02249 [Corchorus capsularis]
MDEERLFEAARAGNIEVLQHLLAKNPLILTDVALSGSRETLLHVAVKAGQLDFAHQIIQHKPEFAGEMNMDGYRPLDIAVITGNTDIVRRLVKIEDQFQIYRLPGKDQRTPLHYAAANGRVEIINEVISTCPDSITDVTVYGETTLHLAVKNNQFQAFFVLINWLEKLNQRALINFKDCDGNSVLHLATARRQYNSLELLVGEKNIFSGVIEVNAKNSKGLTAMDILDIVMENPNDMQIRKILQNAAEKSPSSSNNYIAKEKQNEETLLKDWFKYFKFQWQRDSPSDARNVLLVVAALIATVSFQAGVSPPSGLADMKSGNINKSNISPPPRPPPGQYGSGGAIGPATTGLLAIISAVSGSTQAKAYLFLFGNSIALAASLSIIMYLTGGYPFQRELLISIFAMMFTYGYSVHGLTQKDGVANAIVAVAFVIPYACRWIPRWMNKAWKWWRGPPTSQSNQTNRV